MASTFEDPEELIPCPYDPVHMVARKRMPYHIMKCRKNFGQKDYTICPFNARHVVPKKEFDAHISRCEDRGRVEAEMLRQQVEKSREGVALKGNTSVPTSNFVVESAESWDDSNFSVEIKAHQGLFNQASSSGQRERGGATNAKPHPTRAPVSNPPTLRMPRNMPGTGSEVFDYSVQRQQEERQVPQSQPQPRPKVAGVGRGRGRGRGRGAAGQSAPPPPPSGLASRGKGAEAVRYPPGLAPPQGQTQPGQQPVGPDMSEEERYKLRRKLKKMLRQLETLELKKSNGEVLDSDQESKLQRKDDVVLRLEQVEKLCES